MPFEVTILQDNKVLPVNVVAMLEQRGFQQEQDADAFYITKTYGSSTDAVKEVLELAPNIQLVQHLENDSMYYFQHAEAGCIEVKIRPPLQLLKLDVGIHPPLQHLLNHDMYAKSTEAAPLRMEMLSQNPRNGAEYHSHPQLFGIRSLRATPDSQLYSVLACVATRLSLPAYMFVLDDSGGRYHQITASWGGELAVQSCSRPSMNFCTDLVESQREYIEVLDARESHDYCADELVLFGPQGRHLLGVPVSYEDVRVGVLCVVDVKPATTPLHSSLRKYLRQMAVQLEHSMADSRDGNEADVSSNGVRSDEEGASLGEDSGSNASGGSSCSNASSLLREWGHEREAEIEASREERLIEEWTAASQEVDDESETNAKRLTGLPTEIIGADAVCTLTVGTWFADDEGCICSPEPHCFYSNEMKCITKGQLQVRGYKIGKLFYLSDESDLSLCSDPKSTFESCDDFCVAFTLEGSDLVARLTLTDDAFRIGRCLVGSASGGGAAAHETFLSARRRCWAVLDLETMANDGSAWGFNCRTN